MAVPVGKQGPGRDGKSKNGERGSSFCRAGPEVQEEKNRLLLVKLGECWLRTPR
jgi:hypothetical protein